MKNAQVKERQMSGGVKIYLAGNSDDFVSFCNCLLSYMQSGRHCAQIAEHFQQAVSYMEDEIFLKYEITPTARQTRQNEIFEKFINYVKRHCMESRCVQFYANKLFISAKYLSSIVKEISGKTANQWIGEFVILEAKMLLRSTNLTVQEVSDRMNFPNQSFFGKYFKQHVGVSPKMWISSLTANN